MANGELTQDMSAFDYSPDVQRYLDRIYGKTASLFATAAEGGAIVTGAPEEFVAPMRTFGEQLGMAFQIVDDILDVRGTARELGKTAGKDAAGAKPTYPSVFGLDRASAMADECRERARTILQGARLTDGWLNAIAEWVVTRKR
jgi:geranylgeranyl pyrophosphate synthase